MLLSCYLHNAFPEILAEPIHPENNREGETMPIIEWDEAYCIGNTDIDTQHKELIAYYNAAMNGCCPVRTAGPSALTPLFG